MMSVDEYELMIDLLFEKREVICYHCKSIAASYFIKRVQVFLAKDRVPKTEKSKCILLLSNIGRFLF